MPLAPRKELIVDFLITMSTKDFDHGGSRICLGIRVEPIFDSRGPLRINGYNKATVSMSFPYDLEVIRYTPVIH